MRVYRQLSVLARAIARPRKFVRLGGLTALALLVSCLAALLAGCGMTRKGESGAPLASWLSDRTVLVARAPNVSIFRERWSRTAVGEAWADPGVEYWTAMRFQPAMETLLGRLGAGDTTRLLNLVEGEFVLALELRPVENASTPRSPKRPILAAHARMDFGKKADEARKIMAELESRPPEARPAQSFDGVVLHSERAADGGALCSAWLGNTLQISNSPEALLESLERGASRGRKRADRLLNSPAWNNARARAEQDGDAAISETADVFLFVDVAGVYRRLSAPATWEDVAPNLAIHWDKIRRIGDWLGLEGVESMRASVQMRERGFYSSTRLLMRDTERGVLFPPRDSAALRTPAWMTRDLESYSASRIHAPLEIKNSALKLLKGLSPEAVDNLNALGLMLGFEFGPEWDRFLGALGSEIAVLSGKSESLVESMIATPDFVLLCELRDGEAARQAFIEMIRAMGGSTENGSIMGYPLQTHLTKLPFPIYTGEVNGVFFLSTRDRWFRQYLRTNAELTESDEQADALAPMGAESLLPALEEPFSRLPKKAVVTGRSFSDPGPGLVQMNSALPFLLPVVNMQLKAQGLPALPEWIRSAILPLKPFGENAFPTITRTSQHENVIHYETWSAFDPLMSPFAAMAVVGLSHALEDLAKGIAAYLLTQ